MHEPPCRILLTIVISFTVVGCVLVDAYTLLIPSQGIIRTWSLISWSVKENINKI